MAGVRTFKQDLNIESCLDFFVKKKILYSEAPSFLIHWPKCSSFELFLPKSVFFPTSGADDAKPHGLGNLGKGPKDFQGQRIRSDINAK